MTWFSQRSLIGATLMLGTGLFCPMSSARAELVLSQLVVQLQAGKKMREDIEVWNSSSERAYVAIEPSKVNDPGRPTESRQREPDPAKLGLLVSPARTILEPGQRKLVRIAALGETADQERVYRVTVKPAVGEVASEHSGLKILVGYDVLVLVRPADIRPNVVASRSGDMLTLRNEGNASVELVEGKQCDPGGGNCSELPAKRLYAGAQWSVKLKNNQTAHYAIESGGRRTQREFQAAR